MGDLVETVQLWSIVGVPAGDQERDTERSAHDRFLALGALAESQSQVADGLCATLDTELLIVVESVVLRLDSGVLNHASGVRL